MFTPTGQGLTAWRGKLHVWCRRTWVTPSGQHDASGSNTLCGAISCGANVNVVNHGCTECPAGKTSTGQHDASAGNTAYEATSCGANEKVVNHVCTEGLAGKTSTDQHDASGDNTVCKATSVAPMRKW